MEQVRPEQTSADKGATDEIAVGVGKNSVGGRFACILLFWSHLKINCCAQGARVSRQEGRKKNKLLSSKSEQRRRE